jgi:AraC-like DNA-binding protein
MLVRLEKIADRPKFCRETIRHADDLLTSFGVIVMDVLSDVLRAVRMTGAVFFNVAAGERVVAQTPHMRLVGQQVMPGAEHVIPFHIMLRGQCWVESLDSDDPPVEFSEGDIVFYPHGDSHIFVTQLGERLPPNIDEYRRPQGHSLPIMVDLSEAGPPVMRFVCGYFGCDSSPFNPLLNALPTQVLAKRPAGGNHIEVDLIQAAVAESEGQRAGSETILARLSELLFVQVLRRYIEQLPERSSGWLAALRDPCISRALQAIHSDPSRNWTLEALGREAGMSRAVFAERFTDTISETPMRYLAKWRMQLAAALLSHSDLPVEEVAARVGYQSQAAFSRAFKSIVGTTPGKWRRKRLVTGFSG